MKRSERKALGEYRLFLYNEINELKKRIKPHDTGHIKTTISVLKARMREIDRRIDGYFDWKDEYLIGY